MLTIMSLGAVVALGYILATCVLEIKELSMHETLILILIGIGALYRLIDRWPARLEKNQKYQGEKTPHRLMVEKEYEKFKADYWAYSLWVREWKQLFDYYNILRAVHEWKRERIARSLIETVDVLGHSGNRSKEKAADAKRKLFSRNAYETAERLLNEGQYLPGQEMMERVAWKECPSCKGSGWNEHYGACEQCERYGGRKVPRIAPITGKIKIGSTTTTLRVTPPSEKQSPGSEEKPPIDKD